MPSQYFCAINVLINPIRVDVAIRHASLYLVSISRRLLCLLVRASWDFVSSDSGNELARIASELIVLYCRARLELWLSSSCFCFAVVRWLKTPFEQLFIFSLVIDMGVQLVRRFYISLRPCPASGPRSCKKAKTSLLLCSFGLLMKLECFCVRLSGFIGKSHLSEFYGRFRRQQAAQFNLELFAVSSIIDEKDTIPLSRVKHHRDAQRFNWNWLKSTDCLLSLWSESCFSFLCPRPDRESIRPRKHSPLGKIPQKHFLTSEL